MLTRKNPKNGDELSILGFGCMRLPSKAGAADEAKSIALIRGAIARGVNYFDTAYVYQGGKNETVLGLALEGGYRERVKIATKLPPYMVRKLEGAQKIFSTQLERLKTDHIDYYLLHMLTGKSMFDRMDSLGVLEWMEGLKASGAIGNIGFSFHGAGRDFQEVLKAYPWDFCQIQYNYMDEQNQAGTAGLELAAALGITVIVMEPLRGGSLATKLPPEVQRVFKERGAGKSPAEWALRWVWNRSEVTLLLSGMNEEAQLEENLRIASDAKAGALGQAEMGVFEEVRRILMEKTKVPCTACGYCMPCPSGVSIPTCFSAYNE
jgi:predicted aldo/keto reductase-like oxidoreductase